MRGFPVVISGPSGCGKSSLRAVLLEDPRFVASVSLTTRAPRAGEREGVDYRFVTKEQFDKDVARDGFLEWAEVFGERYGTPRAPIERACAEGRYPLLTIDVQGAARLREQGIEALFVFLLPPSAEELERRLRGRGTEDEATVKRRLARAEREMAERGRYDHQVVNDRVERAAREIEALVESARAAAGGVKAGGERSAG